MIRILMVMIIILNLSINAQDKTYNKDINYPQVIRFLNELKSTGYIKDSSLEYSLDQKDVPREPNIYVSPENKVYVQKSRPYYLKLSTSPISGEDSQLLSWSLDGNSSHSFFFDTEGYNTIRSPWVVNPETKEYVYPKQDVIFEVYADGKPPVTFVEFTCKNLYENKNLKYFGRDLTFKLISKDETSGVKDIFYSLDAQSKYYSYAGNVSLKKENEFVLRYYAWDCVGNTETEKKESFIVDLTSPETNIEIHGSHFKNIFSALTSLSINSNDALSGVKFTKYSIDGGPEVSYNEPLYLKYLKEGLHSLNYYSVDNVNNKENVLTWDFVMDYTPPSISMQVLGDYFKKNDIEYISSRSSLAFQVFDEIAGVSNIQYLVKGQDPEFIPYRAPFIVNGKNGVYRIQYFAIDNVNNKSELKNRSFFLDNEPPVTGINFGSKSFFSRDTLYISKNTNITLFTRDNYSGIRETFYSLNEKAPELYKGKIEIQEEGFLKIFFKSTDNVDNEEQTKVSEVYVDNSPPEIYTNFSIKAIGSKEMNGKAVDVYPNFTHLYIGANDEHSGVGNIHYSINDGPFVLYMDPYMLDVQGVSESVEENKFKIRIKAEDKLGNSKKRTIEFYVSHY